MRTSVLLSLTQPIHTLRLVFNFFVREETTAGSLPPRPSPLMFTYKRTKHRVPRAQPGEARRNIPRPTGHHHPLLEVVIIGRGAFRASTPRHSPRTHMMDEASHSVAKHLLFSGSRHRNRNRAVLSMRSKDGADHPVAHHPQVTRTIKDLRLPRRSRLHKPRVQPLHLNVVLSTLIGEGRRPQRLHRPLRMGDPTAQLLSVPPTIALAPMVARVMKHGYPRPTGHILRTLLPVPDILPIRTVSARLIAKMGRLQLLWPRDRHLVPKTGLHLLGQNVCGNGKRRRQPRSRPTKRTGLDSTTRVTAVRLLRLDPTTSVATLQKLADLMSNAVARKTGDRKKRCPHRTTTIILLTLLTTLRTMGQRQANCLPCSRALRRCRVL